MWEYLASHSLSHVSLSIAALLGVSHAPYCTPHLFEGLISLQNGTFNLDW